MSNVKAQSSKFWAHVVAAWFYTVIICYLLYEEWKIYIIYRQEYLTSGKGHQYAVLVRDLPVKVCDDGCTIYKHVYLTENPSITPCLHEEGIILQCGYSGWILSA